MDKKSDKHASKVDILALIDVTQVLFKLVLLRLKGLTLGLVLCFKLVQLALKQPFLLRLNRKDETTLKDRTKIKEKEKVVQKDTTALILSISDICVFSASCFALASSALSCSWYCFSSRSFFAVSCFFCASRRSLNVFLSSKSVDS